MHGKRRENIKKASGVKGFLVQFFHRQSFCRKALADLPLVHSCIIFICCLDGPIDNDKDHVVGLLTTLIPHSQIPGELLGPQDKVLGSSLPQCLRMIATAALLKVLISSLHRTFSQD